MADLDAYYRQVLNAELEKRVKKNPRYSKNAFAKFLGVSPAYLSKLNSGKILLSLDLADKMTKKLGLSPEERKELILSVAEEHTCHALYLIAPELTECDPVLEKTNSQPQARKKKSKV
jgi:plasmid maintenance system antidote protein VapI